MSVFQPKGSPRRGRENISPGKREREASRGKSRREKERRGKGKPVYVMGNRHHEPLQLRRIGRGWFPDISRESLDYLRFCGTSNFLGSGNVVTLVGEKTSETQTCFRVNMGNPRTKKSVYFGTFLVDLEQKTITKS
ncbi:MAG: hypothetical protein WC634_03335 [archaeon]